MEDPSFAFDEVDSTDTHYIFSNGAGKLLHIELGHKLSRFPLFYGARPEFGISLAEMSEIITALPNAQFENLLNRFEAKLGKIKNFSKLSERDKKVVALLKE